MRKKILFSAYTMDVGGIETALVNLLNELIKKYDITLVLEKKQGVFLKELNNKITVFEYNPNQNKIAIIRKLINLLKRLKFIVKYKNKFDFAGSFATYSKMGSFCARMASKNNALWCHAKYSDMYENSSEIVSFFDMIKYKKFNKIVFVSNEGANDFKAHFPKSKSKVTVCNNLINYSQIISKSNKQISMQKDTIPTFLNISRQEEGQKRLSRIIEASKILKNINFGHRVLMVGSGPDTNKYKEMVKRYNLEDNIVFLGELENPYPYFKIADSLILTSEYEGYPVVFLEAMILGIPILTTNISDSKEEIDGKFGIVVKSSLPEDIANGMKKIIEEKETFNKVFNAEEYNREIIKKIERIINGGNNEKN